MYTVGGGGFRRAVLDTMRRFTVVYRGIRVRVCVRACVFSEQKFMSTLFISFIILFFFFLAYATPAVRAKIITLLRPHVRSSVRTRCCAEREAARLRRVYTAQ